MKQDVLPQVGDVIQSIRFVYGERSFDANNKLITVGRDTPEYIVTRHLTDDEIEEITIRTKKMPTGKDQWVDEDYGSVDLSRAKAEYVVIKSQMQGGGTGHGPHDVYPDGWYVTAQRLDTGRKWNPDGEIIGFYMTGCFINMIPPERVRVVGKMEVSYTQIVIHPVLWQGVFLVYIDH